MPNRHTLYKLENKVTRNAKLEGVETDLYQTFNQDAIISTPIYIHIADKNIITGDNGEIGTIPCDGIAQATLVCGSLTAFGANVASIIIGDDLALVLASFGEGVASRVSECVSNIGYVKKGDSIKNISFAAGFSGFDLYIRIIPSGHIDELYEQEGDRTWLLGKYDGKVSRNITHYDMNYKDNKMWNSTEISRIHPAPDLSRLSGGGGLIFGPKDEYTFERDGWVEIFCETYSVVEFYNESSIKIVDENGKVQAQTTMYGETSHVTPRERIESSVLSAEVKKDWKVILDNFGLGVDGQFVSIVLYPDYKLF